MSFTTATHYTLKKHHRRDRKVHFLIPNIPFNRWAFLTIALKPYWAFELRLTIALKMLVIRPGWRLSRARPLFSLGETQTTHKFANDFHISGSLVCTNAHHALCHVVHDYYALHNERASQEEWKDTLFDPQHSNWIRHFPKSNLFILAKANQISTFRVKVQIYVALMFNNWICHMQYCGRSTNSLLWPWQLLSNHN